MIIQKPIVCLEKIEAVVNPLGQSLVDELENGLQAYDEHVV